MKVHVFKRGYIKYTPCTRNPYEVVMTYCGYLEVDNPLEKDLWHLCNWDCWSSENKPKECENLFIGYCNEDIAFYIDGIWYDDYLEKFSSFEDCYKKLTQEVYYNCSRYNGGYLQSWLKTHEIQFVTPDNISNFIK